MSAVCRCCGGTGTVSPDRPLCATAVQQRDPRGPAQLRRLAGLQRVALEGVAFDGNGQPLTPHGDTYIDYDSGVVVA